MKLVKYDGKGNGYLLILTNKRKQSKNKMPVAALYVPKGQEIAVSDLAVRILKDQDQIGKDKLTVVEEVENTQGPIAKP